MAVFYSAETAGLVTTPESKAASPLGYGAQLRRYRATVTLASQGTSDTIVLARIPAGSLFAFGVMTTSATLGASATVAIGTVTGSATGAGSSGAFTFTISSASGTIKAGQNVSGTGIGTGAVVLSVLNNVVTVSVANSGAVSGTINFGDAAKYRSAAVFTAVDTPTFFGKAIGATGLQIPLPAEEEIVVTIAVAALPSSGTWVVDLYFSGS